MNKVDETMRDKWDFQGFDCRLWGRVDQCESVTELTSRDAPRYMQKTTREGMGVMQRGVIALWGRLDECESVRGLNTGRDAPRYM